MIGRDRDLALIAIAGALIVVVAVTLHFFLATLVVPYWHWWFGFGMFGATGAKCLDELAPRTHRRRHVQVEAPSRLEVIGGGNARVAAEDRWGKAA